jgi:DeoR family transcriptional regulator, aga operon transcriptional repressor
MEWDGERNMAAKHDRAKQILHLLLQKGSGSIEELAAAVDVSPASVRRDLIKLEERGLVNRTHGGAEVAGKMNYEPFRFDAAFPLREERFADEKRRIAYAAANLVEKGDTIALSPGTTTTQIARSLRHREDIHIVTSAVNIGMELSSQPNLSVTLTGGAVRWPGSFSMVGVTAFDALQRLFFEKFFIGACGIHPEHGITVIESDEALILSEMVKHAKEVIAVADCSKLGQLSAMKVCSPAQIDLIITDDGADPALLEQFRSQNIRILSV